MEKCQPWWDLNAQTHDHTADALPTEPRPLMISMAIIGKCHRNGAMRFTDNKNVALSASTITAEQSARPTSRRALIET